MPFEILLITKDADEAVRIREALENTSEGSFSLLVAGALNEAIGLLSERSISALLLDLSLPEPHELSNFETLILAVPDVPIMVLPGNEQQELARKTIPRGGQGIISRGVHDSYLIPLQLRTMIDRKAVEEALFVEKERAEFTLNSIGDAVLSTDMVGNVTYLNTVAEKMTGWPMQEALGKSVDTVLNIIDSETYESSPNPVILVLRHDKIFGLQANALLIRRDGMEFEIEDTSAPIHDLRGRITGAVIIFRDISAMRRLGQRMTYLAQHDFLTDLPNRMLLKDRVEQEITRAHRDKQHPAVLFIDLDNFKHVNDSLSHNVGDKLLQSIAKRLVSCVRSVDTVCRYGGDEFVILISNDLMEDDACLIAEKIITALALPHLIENHTLLITASIGISTYPGDGSDAESLLKNADTAMYHAKHSGKNNYRFFTQDMNIRAIERQNIESDLRSALLRNEFRVFFQPKIQLATGTITGVEVLLRWQHPRKKMLNPKQFIHIAEESGLIVPIGRWVLQEACSMAAGWENAMGIAINISSHEFSQTDFVSELVAILARSGLPPHRLSIELKESVIMRDMDACMLKLRALKDIGIRITIDDFGTGYSNLRYLQQLPIDTLKIDQSFVHEIGTAADSSTIVSAAVAIGDSLHRHVVAEGIENQIQLDYLKKIDCEEGQGFYFSAPMKAEDFPAFLLKNSTGSGISVSDSN
jgi:diguanylate cyclase (GGDEF)-like protein/PAS domain S-box-containing protein